MVILKWAPNLPGLNITPANIEFTEFNGNIGLDWDSGLVFAQPLVVPYLIADLCTHHVGQHLLPHTGGRKKMRIWELDQQLRKIAGTNGGTRYLARFTTPSRQPIPTIFLYPKPRSESLLLDTYYIIKNGDRATLASKEVWPTTRWTWRISL